MNDLKEETLRIIIDKEKIVEKNLALEEAILEILNEDKTQNTFRIWINEKSAIASIHEKIDETINIEFCFEKGIKINRRITGGGTVYHDEGNINWSFFFRRNQKLNFDPVTLYEYFSSFIIQAISTLGFEVRFNKPNWLGIYNRKISGMAGYLKRNALLIHGTLLVNANLVYLRKVCKLHYKYPEVINISDIKPISVQTVIEALTNTIQNNFKNSYVANDLEQNEKEMVAKLEENKYKKLDWIFK
ncbi:MAG: lipoate--protein ligase family protein [Thermoproteota archaeon]